MYHEHNSLIKELRARFKYDPEAGVFTHLRSAAPYHREGSRAEQVHGLRPHLRHKGVKLPAIRVAWAFLHGEFPPGHVGPRNGDPYDLRADNLGLVKEISRDRAKSAECPQCGERFDPRSRRYCSPKCSHAARRKDYLSEEERRDRARRKRLAKLYGLTLEDFDAILARQGHACAICRRAPESGPVVDHCHETGRVRGILCGPCNSGMGQLGDSPSRLLAAAAYLQLP